MFRVYGVAILMLFNFWAATALAEEAIPTTHDGIVALQQRLTDAGCYKGSIDGVAWLDLVEAVKACPDMKPFLRIETGMHTASIRRIGVDAECTLVATASEDKTVRLWSLPDGRLRRTIRLPIGDGDGGKVYATTLSPDGRWMAAGGLDASSEKTGTYSLTLIDLRSGDVRRLGALEDAINYIAFSRDGGRIAVGGGGKGGLSVYDVVSGQELLADRDYRDGIYGLDFAPDGGLVVASWDGALRRYDAGMHLTAKHDAPGGKRPYAVSIDPYGKHVAVGYYDKPRVSLLDAATLTPAVEAETRDINSANLASVAWSRDGSALIAGGLASARFDGVWRRFFRRFDAAGHRIGQDGPAADNTIMDVHACGRGFAFAAYDPSFGLVDSNGTAKTLQGARTADMRDKLADALTISNDASDVRFGLGDRDQAPVAFELGAATLLDAPKLDADLRRARMDGLPVSNWHYSYEPKFKSRRIELEPYEISRSLAVRPNNDGFALGADWFVRAFDSKGAQLWKQAGPGAAWGVDLSADGEIIVVAYDDGTIRWLRWSDGQELLALFVDRPTRRWVAWTPTGYYMASPGGEDLIGWHLNRGWTQLADFFPASHFQGFNRPDIVQLVLTTRDEAEAVRQANEKIKAKPAPALATMLPPVVTIASAGENGRFSSDTVEVSFDVRSPSGLAVDRVEALIDGRPVEARGLAPANETQGDPSHLTISAPAHDFELALIAHAGSLTSEPATTKLTWIGGAAKDPPEQLKPKLYVVTVGVSDYAKEELRLNWANEDARGFSEAIEAQSGGLYSEVKLLPPLVDRAVTRSSVIAALRWLRKQATSRDVGMVLIAGHGVTDDGGNYYFLPSDATPEDLDGSGVSQDDILREMRQIAGKAILFLDTCHANQAVANGVARRGSTNIDSVVNEFSRAENGLVVFSASRGRETSRETAEWRHGAFTKALIEGLAEGKADLLHQGTITLSELDAFLTDRVKVMTDGEQHPVMTRPPTMPDFPFATPRR